jgi:molecular chaperone IbpA
MRLDLTPYRRSTIGFDRLFDLLETSARAGTDNYPPFNLERVADDRYRITLAVAGFSRDEVEDARLNDGLLVIDLVREVPEAVKPKTIAIKTGAPLAAVEVKADEAKAA